MNLLPKEHGEFVKPEYWEKFFKKRGAKAFEWYGDYPELCGVLHKYMRPRDRVLVVGCGNSQLSADLYDVGYHSIVNIDISDVVIKQMREKHQQRRPDLLFHKMDVVNLDYSDTEFSVVLDKGTLDALMADSSEAVVAKVEAMFGEIDRVLKPMGRYVCISLLQEHILLKVLHFFSLRGWAIRIHKIQREDSDSSSSRDFQLPVFAFVLTKFIKHPGIPQIYEMCTSGDTVERCASLESLANIVRELQYYAVLKHRLTTRKETEDQVALTLYNNLCAFPRYTLTIVDSPSRLSNKFAIFIVPQGRETEWMFSTNAGRSQLSNSAGFERLVVVTLDRNHEYSALDTIKLELSAKVMELAPPAFKHGTKVPFLSVGEDIGQRTVRHRGHSEGSGDYVVEDVQGNAAVTYRRLVFLSSQNIIQSEARLTEVKDRGKGKRLCVDMSYLACQHHIAMVAGLAMVQRVDFPLCLDTHLSCLLVGLGGAGLPSYIHRNFPQVTIDVVEIDSTMVAIATEWFGFAPDDKLQVHVTDGLDFIREESKKGGAGERDVVMLDVDSKDATLGMSCPPQAFVDSAFLANVKAILRPGGVLILNLVCRDAALKFTVLARIQSLFPTVFMQAIAEEVNNIVYAVNCETALNQCELMKRVTENLTYMDKSIRNKNRSSHHELVELLEELKIL